MDNVSDRYQESSENTTPYDNYGLERSLAIYLREIGRTHYTIATDQEALSAFHVLAETEGILAALESSHAVAEAIKRAPHMKTDQIVLVNLSGRGDKDLETIMQALKNDQTQPSEGIS